MTNARVKRTSWTATLPAAAAHEAVSVLVTDAMPVRVAFIHGVVDQTTVHAYGSLLMDVCDGCAGAVIIDFEGVRSIDTGGLELLNDAVAQLESQRIGVAIVTGTAVYEALRSSGATLDGIICRNLCDALQVFGL